MNRWQENIRQIVPYTPGEQPNFENMVKLNTNENPYPPSPLVAKALQELSTEKLRLYPDPTCYELVHTLANYYKVEDQQVFVGVGSDDVLATAFLAFFNGSKPILFPDITYSFYKVWAELYRVPYETPALDEQFKLIKEDYYKPNGGIILANPNAPTSIYEPLDTIEDILKHNQDSIVIVDEAYIDFAGDSAITLLDRYENLLVVQTFSKSRAMAGMRIGFALGSPTLIKALNDVKYSINSYTLNLVSLKCGVASLQDEPSFQKQLENIISTREWTKDALRKLGFSFFDSQSNFIFATHPQYEGKVLFEALKKANIFVRYFNSPRINQYLRISIGTPEEMEKLVSFLENYIK